MKNVYNVTQKDLPIKQLSGNKSLFKKQLIRFGDWIDPIFPDQVMRIDRVFLENLVKNFNANVPGRIPIPLTHTDNPEFNTGELVELVIEGDGTNLTDGLYGIMDIRREETADDIRNELIFDVSISFTDNYQDNENGALYGPTLLHVALVNNPYIKKMNPFTALAESLSKQFGTAVHMLSESTKENIVHKVKNDREFAVELSYKKDEEELTVTLEPGKELELSEDQVEAVTKQLSDAVAPETEEEKTAREAQEAEDAKKEAERKAEEEKNLSESDQIKRELAETKAKLLDKEITDEYTKQLNDGKIVPAQKDAFIALSYAVHGQTRQLSDGNTQNLSELLAEFVEKAPKVVSLNEENGNTDPQQSPHEDQVKEVRDGLQATGTTEEDYVRYGAGKAVSAAQLSELNKEK